MHADFMFMGGWGADALLKNEITSALNATYANVDIEVTTNILLPFF